jgi:hypothetical protein
MVGPGSKQVGVSSMLKDLWVAPAQAGVQKKKYASYFVSIDFRFRGNEELEFMWIPALIVCYQTRL